MSLNKKEYIPNETVITADNLNEIQDEIIKQHSSITNLKTNFRQLNTDTNNRINNISSRVWPIGSIYTTINSSNPISIFQNNTTWELISSSVIDTGWQDFIWQNATYYGTSQSCYTLNKWRIKDNILYVVCGAGAAKNISLTTETELFRLPIKVTELDNSKNRVWNAAIGMNGVYGGFMLSQGEENLSVWLKPRSSSGSPWFSTFFAYPLKNDFVFTNGLSFEREYKWKRVK